MKEEVSGFTNMFTDTESTNRNTTQPRKKLITGEILKKELRSLWYHVNGLMDRIDRIEKRFEREKEKEERK